MKTEQKIVTTTTLKLEAKDILDMLRIPEDATDINVWIAIPGGGDYSNMDLNVDAATPIRVSYKVVT